MTLLLLAACAHHAPEDEARAGLNAIVTAELAFDATTDHYQPCAPWPRPVAELTAKAVDWPEGSDFDRIGYLPKGHTRTTYSVEVNPKGTDFLVHAWQDLDGDGVPAH
jgi:hypothetical protein